VIDAVSKFTEWNASGGVEIEDNEIVPSRKTTRSKHAKVLGVPF
jgi:hypothetical protein